MASFGENLRQAREARNITLQEIAATTKISSRALQALEDEHFEQLPGGIFNKGFVRAYARCVGLDEEKTVAEYLAQPRWRPSEIDMEVMSTQVAAAAGARQPWAPNAATVVGVLAVIVALGMGALWLNEQRKETRELTSGEQGGECSGARLLRRLRRPVASEPNPRRRVAESERESGREQERRSTGDNNAATGVASPAVHLRAPPARRTRLPKTLQSTSPSSKPAGSLCRQAAAASRPWERELRTPKASSGGDFHLGNRAGRGSA